MGRREKEKGVQRGIIGSRLLGRGAELGFGPPCDPVLLSVMKGWRRFIVFPGRLDSKTQTWPSASAKQGKGPFRQGEGAWRSLSREWSSNDTSSSTPSTHIRNGDRGGTICVKSSCYCKHLYLSTGLLAFSRLFNTVNLGLRNTIPKVKMKRSQATAVQ
ncbi:hypothetical protein BJX62DRAFT_206494 [Aspergillus germanicus]